MKKFLFLSLLGLPVLFLGGCSLINNNDSGINTGDLEKITQLEQQLSGLLEQSSGLQAENENLKESLSGAVSSLKTLQTENETLQTDIDKYKKMVVEDKLSNKNTANTIIQNNTVPTNINTTTKEIGYIKQVYIDSSGKKKLEIDYVQQLGPDECIKFNSNSKPVDIPGIFCLVNENPKLRTFTISNNVEIFMQTLSHTSDGSFNRNQNISFDYFKQKFNDFKAVPYRITIENNTITKIEEQYIS